MELARQVLEDMIDHASEQFPLESCGLLVGRPGRIERLVRVKNLLGGRSEFAMEPREIVRVIRDHRNHKLGLVGIYHSHPASPARPSNRDIEEFYYRDASYWIVSLQEKSEPVVRCFRWRNETLSAQPYAICESRPGPYAVWESRPG